MLNVECDTFTVQKTENGFLVYSFKPVPFNQYQDMANAFKPLINKGDELLDNLLDQQKEFIEPEKPIKYFVCKTYEEVLKVMEKHFKK